MALMIPKGTKGTYRSKKYLTIKEVPKVKEVPQGPRADVLNVKSFTQVGFQEKKMYAKNLNCDKMKYLIKYTLTVFFSLKESYMIQFIKFLPKKYENMDQKVDQKQ